MRDRKRAAVFLKREKLLGFVKQKSRFFGRRLKQPFFRAAFVEQGRFKGAAFVGGVARLAENHAVGRSRIVVKEERHEPTVDFILGIAWVYEGGRERIQ